jgi:hypothetical protein
LSILISSFDLSRVKDSELWLKIGISPPNYHLRRISHSEIYYALRRISKLKILTLERF